ncbi:hypothetical protein VSS86_19540, partial [Bacillus safensis]|uniref:hypothetical protein n=1 Tax=Bacillus safensis TaxID=561879 RepID=UPI002DD44449
RFHQQTSVGRYELGNGSDGEQQQTAEAGWRVGQTAIEATLSRQTVQQPCTEEQRAGLGTTEIQVSRVRQGFQIQAPP